MNRWIFALSLVFGSLAACSGNTVDDLSTAEEADTDDLEEKGDGVTYPVGTYEAAATAAGELTLLVLKTDKTFYAEQFVVCITAPCNPVAIEGKYKFTKSSTKKYLRLLDEDGELIVRYAYKLSSGGTLKIAPSPYTKFASLKAVETDRAWCESPADCKIQNLPQPKCPGKWLCETGMCHYSECSLASACETAGGQCVGLTPTNCKDGTVGDATKYSCGGMVGVMCCLPKQTSCEAAGGACVGLTPTNCKDGKVGDANVYSCGGGLGVMCCLPADVPTCQKSGTSQEGWYWPDGSRICLASCKGAAAKCSAIGSKSEGFYADGQGCSGGNLISWSNCAE